MSCHWNVDSHSKWLDRDSLFRQTQFQHTELVGKKEKITSLEEKIHEETKTREASIRLASQAVKKRRNKAATQGKPEHSSDKQVHVLEKELQEIDNERVWPKWPRLVEQEATAITMEAGELHDTSASVRMVLEGYRKHVGDVVVDENAPVSMAQ